MPTYTINGKKVTTDRALSEDEIDEIAVSVGAPSQSTAEENLDAWLSEPESESDIISYGELGAKATVEDLSEVLSFDDISRKETKRVPAARETDPEYGSPLRRRESADGCRADFLHLPHQTLPVLPS